MQFSVDQSGWGTVQSGTGKAAGATVVRMTLVVTAVAVTVVLLGGTAAWLAEHRMPGSTVRSWGDGLWWALTTLTTVGYGDHVPVTVAGRLIAAAVMITGVAVLGSVAAGIALIVARTVAATEEQALEVEAKSIEQRLEARFDDLDERLARIEKQLQQFTSRTGVVHRLVLPTSRTDELGALRRELVPASVSLIAQVLDAHSCEDDDASMFSTSCEPPTAPEARRRV